MTPPKEATAVTVGLVVGKPLGVVLAMWLALRFRLGTLPVGLTMRHLLVLGRVLLIPVGVAGAAETADEAESSTEL